MERAHKINSWRICGKVSENRVLIELPENSNVEEVEIIIIPLKMKTESTEALKEDEDGWKKDFLSISKWDTFEEEVRTKSWEIQKY